MCNDQGAEPKEGRENIGNDDAREDNRDDRSSIFSIGGEDSDVSGALEDDSRGEHGSSSSDGVCDAIVHSIADEHLSSDAYNGDSRSENESGSSDGEHEAIVDNRSSRAGYDRGSSGSDGSGSSGSEHGSDHRCSDGGYRPGVAISSHGESQPVQAGSNGVGDYRDTCGGINGGTSEDNEGKRLQKLAAIEQKAG